jgi:lipoprotein-releasing system permease protein
MTLFCLAGAIAMIIIDKKENIHTMYNIGLPMRKIRKIFFMQGIIITIGGLLLGLIIGSIIIIVQQHYSLFMISENIPYPVLFKFENISVVTATILILGTISSWIASGRVKKQII